MNTPAAFKAYKPQRAFQEIAGEIKKAILDSTFKKGERLPSERALSEQFNVGRLTIREALRTLETSGLIRIKKGSKGGAFVGGYNPENMASMIIDNLTLEGLTNEQITDVRVALECGIIQSAIKNATKEDLNKIKQYIREWEIIEDPEMSDELLKTRCEFHLLLANASHNIPFILFLRTLLEWTQRRLSGRHFPTPEEQILAHRFHKQMFEAIKNKNLESAQDIMKKRLFHLNALIDDLKETS